MSRALLHRCIALAICCACLVNLGSSLGSAALDIYQALRKSPVAAAEITVGKTLETCHHHPQGCPKDCFCPKTLVHTTVQAAVTAEEFTEPIENPSGMLRETSWVNCSEDGPTAPQGLFALSLPESGPGIFLPSPRGARRAEAGIALLEARLLPPQKIPIV